MFDRVQASRGRSVRVEAKRYGARCSTLVDRAGPSACQFVAPTLLTTLQLFDGDQCSSRLTFHLPFWFALAVFVLAFADVQKFSAALVLVVLRSLFLRWHVLLTVRRFQERKRETGTQRSEYPQRVQTQLRGVPEHVQVGLVHFPNEQYVSGERSACFFLAHFFTWRAPAQQTCINELPGPLSRSTVL